MANKRALSLTRDELGLFSDEHSIDGFEESNTIGSATGASASPDNLLSWIDSLRARANETIKSQEKETRRFSQISRQEVLREKYRHHINAELFTPLEQLAQSDEGVKTLGTDEPLDEINSSDLAGRDTEIYHLIGNFAEAPGLILSNQTNSPLSDDDIIEITSESECHEQSATSSENEDLSGTYKMETDNESYAETERFIQAPFKSEEDFLITSDSKIDLLDQYGQTFLDQVDESVMRAERTELIEEGYLQSAPRTPAYSGASSHDSTASSGYSENSEYPQVPSNSREDELESAACSSQEEMHHSMTSAVSLDFPDDGPNESINVFGPAGHGSSAQEGDISNTGSSLVENEDPPSGPETERETSTPDSIGVSEFNTEGALPQDDSLYFDPHDFALVAGAALKEETIHDEVELRNLLRQISPTRYGFMESPTLDPSAPDSPALSSLGKEITLHSILFNSESSVKASVQSAPSMSADSSKSKSPSIALAIPDDVSDLSSASFADAETENRKSRPSSPLKFDSCERAVPEALSLQARNKHPVFKTVSESRPEEQLAALRVMERKYGFKLKVVHDLEHQLGVAESSSSELDLTLFHECQATPANELKNHSETLNGRPSRACGSMTSTEFLGGAVSPTTDVLHTGENYKEISFPQSDPEKNVLQHLGYPPILKPVLENVDDEFRRAIDGTCDLLGAILGPPFVPLAEPTSDCDTDETSDYYSATGDSSPKVSKGKQCGKVSFLGDCAVSRQRLLAKEVSTRPLTLLNNFLIKLTSVIDGVVPFSQIKPFMWRTQTQFINRKSMTNIKSRRGFLVGHDDNDDNYRLADEATVGERDLVDFLQHSPHVATSSADLDFGAKTLPVKVMTTDSGDSSCQVSPQAYSSSMMNRVNQTVVWLNNAFLHIGCPSFCHLLVSNVSEYWSLRDVSSRTKRLLGLSRRLPITPEFNCLDALKTYPCSPEFLHILKKAQLRKFRLQVTNPLFIISIRYKGVQCHRKRSSLASLYGKRKQKKRQGRTLSRFPGDVEAIADPFLESKYQKRIRITISKYGYAHRIAELVFHIPRHEILGSFKSGVASIALHQAEPYMGAFTEDSAFNIDRSTEELEHSSSVLPSSPAVQNWRLARTPPYSSEHKIPEMFEELLADLTKMSVHFSRSLRLEDSMARSEKSRATRKREQSHSRDHAAFRTRSRSPIKRSLYEIIADAENLSHKRGRLARRDEDDQS